MFCFTPTVFGKTMQLILDFDMCLMTAHQQEALSFRLNWLQENNWIELPEWDEAQ